jgi:ABC-2 type transport system permease protein
MRSVWIVFWREILVRLKDWRFWVGTLSFPVLIFLVWTVPALIERFSQKKEVQVLVVGDLPLPAEQSPFRFVPSGGAPLDSLKALLHEGQEDLVILVLPQNPVESETCTLYTAFSLSAEKMEALKSILTEAFRTYRQAALHLTSEALTKLLTPPRIQVYKVSEAGAERYSVGLATTIGIFIGLALFVLLLGAGYQILASVVEEKSNRLVEYLLLSVAPTQILRGKVLAGLILSVFQMIVWGLALLWGGSLAFSMLMEVIQGQLHTIQWLWVVSFSLLGLLLYTFLYAAAGATSESVTELSPLSQALQWPLILSVMVLPMLAAAGEGPVLKVLSYFPLTSPVYMPVRLIATQVSIWEAASSLGILFLTLLGTERLAARLYKHALLLYGQKLSWKAIWQIIRG